MSYGVRFATSPRTEAETGKRWVPGLQRSMVQLLASSDPKQDGQSILDRPKQGWKCWELKEKGGEREREKKKLKYGETSDQLLHIHYRSSIMFHLESLAAVHGCHNGCLCRGLEAMTPPPQICATIPRTRLNLQSGRCHDLINTCHATTATETKYASFIRVYKLCSTMCPWYILRSFLSSWASWALQPSNSPSLKAPSWQQEHLSHVELPRRTRQVCEPRSIRQGLLTVPWRFNDQGQQSTVKIGTKYANKENKSDNNARNQQDK